MSPKSDGVGWEIVIPDAGGLATLGKARFSGCDYHTRGGVTENPEEEGIWSQPRPVLSLSSVLQTQSFITDCSMPPMPHPWEVMSASLTQVTLGESLPL